VSDLYVCTWRDSWADHSETKLSEFADDCIVTTVGYLVRDAEDLVSLAQEILEDGSFRCVTHIWRSLILSLTCLSTEKE
jgi:hypothetical protein